MDDPAAFLLAEAANALSAGRPARAAQLAGRGLSLSPDHPALLRLAAEACLADGQYPAALAHARHLLTVRPRDSWAAHLLAVGLEAVGQPGAAENAWRVSLALNPDNHRALAGLAALLAGTKACPAQAVPLWQKVTALCPDDAQAWQALGRAAAVCGRLPLAAQALGRAVDLQPNVVEAHGDLGVVLRRLGRLSEAEACHRAALALAPQRAETRWNLGNVLLAQGRYAEGFALAEARFDRPGAPALPPLPGPPWDGTPLRRGATLLLAAEQGVGDLLQMLRLVRSLAQAGVAVVVQCRAEVAAVVATAPGVAAVVPLGETVPPYDAWLPLMSLPHRLGLTLEGVSALTPPYLTVPAASPPPPLPPRGARRRLGLVWRGNPGFVDNAARSLRLTDLAPLGGVAGWEVVLLQPTANREPGWQSHALPVVADLGDWLSDYARTAAALAALDLLVSVDTSALHLAAALGRPVWGLLSSSADWRWGTAEVSPWYPALRLFRQRSPGDWATVVAAVAEALGGDGDGRREEDGSSHLTANISGRC